MMSILIEAPTPPAAQPDTADTSSPREAFHGVPEMDGATLVAPPTIPPDPSCV